MGGALVARCDLRVVVVVSSGARGRVRGGGPLRLGNVRLVPIFESCRGCLDSGMGASLFLGWSTRSSGDALRLRVVDPFIVSDDADDKKDNVGAG